MAIRIQARRGTAAEWTTANPILADGETGYETDTGNVKYGNGVDAWADLPYGVLGNKDAGGPPADVNPKSVLGRALSRAQVMPYLTPLLHRAEPLRTIHVQEPDGTVYGTWSRTGGTFRFEKSTDGGATWTTKAAALPVEPKCIVKLDSGTLLLIQNSSTTTAGGSNPSVYRSIDDGATWTLVTTGLKFPPLSAQGVVQGSDGSVMVGEYGNIGPFAYSIRRSTDDGVTWSAVLTTDGVEPSGDPGHFHSVTYDHIAGKHIAFSDRPIDSTYGGPRIYVSSDNGATWAVLGVSDGLYTPNFVAPMYFENYIAWASDNQINGWVGRISRTDFYAGNFDNTEEVVQLDQKASYETFPVRDGVWLFVQKVEHISSPEQTGGYGSHASTVLVVDEDGSRVSGGIESYYDTAAVGSPTGIAATLPAYAFGQVEHEGICWINMPQGFLRPRTATPVTQGWAPPMTTMRTTAIPYLKDGVSFYTQRSTGNKAIVQNNAVGYVAVGPDTDTSANANMRLMDTGDIEFRDGATVVAVITKGEGAFRFNGAKGLTFTTAGLGIRAGNGDPTGVVSAPVGTLYLNWSGTTGTTLWVKETGGTGSAGWVAK